MIIGLYFSDLFNKIGDNVDILPLLGLDKNNHVSKVYSFSGNKSTRAINKNYQKKGNLFFLLYNIFLLRKKIDVFHVFCGLKWTIPIIIIFLKLLKIKVIYSPFGQMLPFHNQNKGILKNLIINTVYKYSFRNTTFHCSSSYELNHLKSFLHKSINYFITPLAVNLNNEIIERDIDKKNKTILYFGRFDIWQKGLDIMLHSIYLSRKVLVSKDFNVVLAGRCSKLELEKIYDLVKKYELDRIVKILPNVSESQRLFLYTNSYIFFHPSRIEGLARSMRDTFKFQLPILTTLDSNADYYFNNSQIGYITSFDADSLSKSLNKFVNCSEKDYVNFSNNMKKIYETYDSENYSKNLFHHYKNLAKV